MQPYSAEWFQSALNAMSDLVLIKGPRSHLLWANKAFLDYYGLTEAGLRDIIDADHSDPDDTLQYVIDDQTVFDTAAHLDIPSEVVTDARGTIRHFHTIKSPIFEGGSVTRSVGVSRPVDGTLNSREVDHQDAKAFAAPLRSLTSNFPNPMLMVDVKKRIVKSSPLWAESFGNAAPSPNAFFEETYPALTELNAAIDRCLASREHVQAEIKQVTADGAEQHFSVQISPWQFSDQVLGGATVVATDISALHQKTVSLERANDELVQFSYRASHDLKGPLSTVKGLANFIADDIEDGAFEEARANAKKIESMMNRLEETVIAILALARADLQEEHVATITLPALLGEICEGLTHQIAYGAVEIEHAFQTSALTCQPTRLRQIVENLVANGIKYRSPARSRSFVKVGSRQVPGGVEISVEDNGLGLPAGSEDKLFDLFSRFHTGAEGSGLGLAIVKKHVDALGGRIDVDRLAEGTAFRVLLPQKTQEATQ